MARRLEFKGESHGVQIFDDYGHHPTEIIATIEALRLKIGTQRLVILFQPHRYTRVRDCFEEFLGAFEGADLVILTDIYSAGERPIEGITTAYLEARMRERLGEKLHFIARPELEKGATALLQSGDVVLTIGAGDVTRVGEALLTPL